LAETVVRIGLATGAVPMVQDFKDGFTDMSHFPGGKTGAIAHMARSLQADSDAAAKQRPRAFTVHH